MGRNRIQNRAAELFRLTQDFFPPAPVLQARGAAGRWLVAAYVSVQLAPPTLTTVGVRFLLSALTMNEYPSQLFAQQYKRLSLLIKCHATHGDVRDLPQ